MTRVKICGITQDKDAAFCVEAGADALGFVFADSPRRIKPDDARRIIQLLPPFVQSVGVFVGDDPSADELADWCGLDALQIHTGYSKEYIAGLRHRRLILGVRVKDEASVAEIGDVSRASALLLDSWSKEAMGGTGQSFDWGLLRVARSHGKPIILSGGLTPENAADAARLGPYALDVSSGVELAPGIKDHSKVRLFIERARNPHT